MPPPSDEVGVDKKGGSEPILLQQRRSECLRRLVPIVDSNDHRLLRQRLFISKEAVQFVRGDSDVSVLLEIAELLLKQLSGNGEPALTDRLDVMVRQDRHHLMAVAIDPAEPPGAKRDHNDITRLDRRGV